MHANPLVAKLQKPASEFTKADIVSYIEVLQMDLNEEEKAKFAASADVIHEMIEEIGMDRG